MFYVAMNIAFEQKRINEQIVPYHEHTRILFNSHRMRKIELLCEYMYVFGVCNCKYIGKYGLIIICEYTYINNNLMVHIVSIIIRY